MSILEMGNKGMFVYKLYKARRLLTLCQLSTSVSSRCLRRRTPREIERSGKLDTLGLRPCVWRQSYKSSKICALRKHHRNNRNPVNQENPSYASCDGEPETSPERIAQGEKNIPDHCCWHSCIDPFLGIVISDSDEFRSLLVHQALGPVSNDFSTVPR